MTFVYSEWQITVLHMKRLNQTESPIFVIISILCFQIQPFFLLLLQCLSVLLALRLPRLGKRELILVLFVRLFDLCLFGLSVSFSSWCLGRAAVCNCSTTWTLLLPFLAGIGKRASTFSPGLKFLSLAFLSY